MKWIKIKSIKKKIMITFSVTFFLMLGLLILINHFFMDDFYAMSNKTRMTEVAYEFEAFSRTGEQGKGFELLRRSGILYAIFSKEYRLLPGSVNDADLIQFFEVHIKDLKEEAENSDGTFYSVIGNNDSGKSLLVLVRILDHGDVLVLTKKMALAREVSLLNFRFMLLTSVFIYGVALIIIFLISSNFSKPIIEMLNKTENMSKLDFSEKIEVNSFDEIGMLSKAINKMSDELSLSIRDLDDSNQKLNLELEKGRMFEKMRKRFVSDVSHELKNPISMIQGYADGLKHNIPKTEEDKAYYYQVIVEESIKMNQLIKDLLDLSSYESGTFTLKKEVLDLAQIVNKYLHKERRQIGDKKVTIEVEDLGAFYVFGDGLRLEQVVANLFINAIKYVNENGKIRVEFRKKDDQVSLIIANTGSLIPENELDHIWTSFYQIDNTKKGSGLGLAIIKSIIQLHGGDCRAYLDGTFNCFEVSLPCLNKEICGS